MIHNSLFTVVSWWVFSTGLTVANTVVRRGQKGERGVQECVPHRWQFLNSRQY